MMILYDYPLHLKTETFIKDIIFIYGKGVMNYNYSICITGPIGVGKSTLIESLEKACNNGELEFLKKDNGQPLILQQLPEYLGIDLKHGQTMLERKINGELSNLTFQNYVIDMYKLKLSSLSTNYDIRICERIPEDSVYCFSNLSNADGELSDFDLYVLKQRFDKLKNTFDLPSYGDNETKFSIIQAIDFKSTYEQAIELMKDDLANGVHKRVIGLTAPFEIVYERIVKRARNGEEKYDQGWLRTITNFYDKLYHYIETDRPSLNRFTCFGSLITP